ALTNLVPLNYSGRIKIIEGEREVLPGLRVHRVGGHTAGLQIVSVETARGRVVLTSDAAHFYRNVERYQPTQIITSLPEMLAGVDGVTDGEQSRQDFVHGFLERLEGIDFGKRVTIGIRADRYKAEVPTVTGPIARRAPVHVDEVRWARAHTTRRLKFTIPGPMTIVDTLADEHYHDRARLALAFARGINEEARELVARGLG